jgi:hypothetical protein
MMIGFCRQAQQTAVDAAQFVRPLLASYIISVILLQGEA